MGDSIESESRPAMIEGSIGTGHSVGIRFLNRGGYGNGGVHSCHLEQFPYARAHSGGNQPDAFTVAAYIMPNDYAQAGRIHVGNVGQVENVDDRRRLVWCRLEIEHVS